MFLKGLYTALITPFTAQGQLDEKVLRHHICNQIEQGVDGLVLLGTTGETPTLTPYEQERIITIGVQEAKGVIPILVGTGCYSTVQTIEQTKRAKELGADAALIVTPYYNKPTQEGIFLHFQSICQAVDIPICLYNIQGRTGQNIQTDTLKRISHLPNIIGIKEASGNISQMDEVIHTFNHNASPFSILSGDDAFTLPLMALGGHGVISVVSNLLPKPVRELVRACSTADFDRARDWHSKLTPFFKGAFIETNPIPIKAAMNLCGIPVGSCRLPLCELGSENKEKLKQLVQNIPQEWFY